MFYSNRQLKSHYTQFCIKHNIHKAEIETYLTDVCNCCLCLGQIFKAQISLLILLENILLGKCVLVGLFVTKAIQHGYSTMYICYARSCHSPHWSN